MFKKIMLTIALFFMLTAVAMAGCIVSSGSTLYLATTQGMVKVYATMDATVTVDPPEKQPPAELLQQFSAKVNENWTDGVSIADENGYHFLAHERDLHCN